MLVIGAALAIMAVAGVLYLRTEAPGPTTPIVPAPIRFMNGPYTATYDFITPSLGWALVTSYGDSPGLYLVFRTTDGAAHWTRQLAGSGHNFPRLEVRFFDARSGFLYADLIYRTVDGGDHWHVVAVPGASSFVDFASSVDGWAQVFEQDATYLYRTTDGGKSWSRMGLSPQPQSLLLPAFRASGEGWLGSDQQDVPRVFVTMNGGASWQTIEFNNYWPSPGVTYETTVRLLPHAALVVFVMNEHGGAFNEFKSLDQGDTWFEFSLPAGASPSDEITFIDAEHWWVFHAATAYTTDDSGRSWTQAYGSRTPSSWVVQGGRGIDRTHAWQSLISEANSQMSALAITADLGGHWRMVSAPQP